MVFQIANLQGNKRTLRKRVQKDYKVENMLNKKSYRQKTQTYLSNDVNSIELKFC